MSHGFEYKNALLSTSRPQSAVLQQKRHESNLIGWPLCVQAGIFRDWAVHMKNKRSLQYFDRSIAICNRSKTDPCCSLKTYGHRGCCTIEDSICKLIPEMLYKRSKCLRALGQPELALVDAEKAHDISKQLGIPIINNMLNKCDALLECNRFEDYLLKLNQEIHNYTGNAIRERFRLRASHICRVIYHALGAKLRPFMLHNWNEIMTVRSRPKPPVVMVQPQWLQERQHENLTCDVESCVQINKEILSPLEQVRRRFNRSQYYYKYLRSNIPDLNMLYRLKSEVNSFRLLSQDFPCNMLSEQIAIVKKFMKMSHSRSPLYLSKYPSDRTRQWSERYQAHSLMRVVYQTCRDSHRMLRELRYRRQTDNIDQLTNYVEHIMSSFIVYKTSRTMPWKFKFVNDVYNMLGMAHIDRCTLPKNIQLIDLKNSSILYRLPADRPKDLTLCFGGHNIYADIDKENERQAAVVKKLEHLKSRLTHSRYAIERAYLLFEIGRCQLKEARHEKTITMAQRALLEAVNCNSYVWRFNITFLLCQVYAILNRYEQLNDTLETAKRLAAQLGSDKLVAYLELCSAVNRHVMDQRKTRSNMQPLKSRRLKDLSSGTSSFDSVNEVW